MNNLKELEKINDKTFKILVYYPIVMLIGNFILLKNNQLEYKEIYIFNIILIIINAILFIKDRKNLKEKKAFVPAWEWFFIFPVYVYKRQENNFLSKSYFTISLILYILTIIISKYLASQN